MGAIVISRRGSSRPDGTPVDVDREFVMFFRQALACRRTSSLRQMSHCWSRFSSVIRAAQCFAWADLITGALCDCSVMNEMASSLFVANLNTALGPEYVGSNGLPEVSNNLRLLTHSFCAFPTEHAPTDDNLPDSSPQVVLNTITSSDAGMRQPGGDTVTVAGVRT